MQRTRHRFLSLPLILGVLLITAAPLSAQVLITKVRIAGSHTTDEFVELYNTTSSTIPLTGWSLKKQTAGGSTYNLVTSFGSTASINPFSYFLIVHPDSSFTSTTDYTYSNQTNSLSANNSVALYDAGSNLLSSVGWGTTSNMTSTPPNPGDNKSLTRKSTLGLYHSTGSSLLDFEETTDPPFTSNHSTTPVVITDPIPDTTSSTPSGEDTASSTATWSDIHINEFVSDPVNGKEWIELYNTASSSFNMEEGTLCDSRASCLIAELHGSIEGKSWIVIELTSNYLNNSGDTITLKDPSGTVVDTISYAGASAPAKGYALARKSDGTDTDTIFDWALTTLPTPGSTNTIIAPPEQVSLPKNTAPSAAPSNPNPTPPSLTITTSTSPLILHEIYPAPPTGKGDDEFIEFFNRTTAPLDARTWFVSTSQKIFYLNTIVPPLGWYTLYRSSSSITLKNTGVEIVELYSNSSTLNDTITFTALPAASLNRTTSSTWEWSEEITPNTHNIFTPVDNHDVVWNVQSPIGVTPGAVAHFDASHSADPRGGQLFYEWRLPDGVTTTGATLDYYPATPGIYPISIKGTSTQGTRSRTVIYLTVLPPSTQTLVSTDTAYLSEIAFSPEPFIELFNPSTSTVDLSGWQLSTQDNDPFVLPPHTTIAPHDYVVFSASATHLRPETTDVINLLDPNSTLRDAAAYEKKLGASFARTDTWQWFSSSSPFKGAHGQVLGVKITTASNNPESHSKATASMSPLLTSITAARNAQSGARVKLSGTVTTLPGTHSANSWYLSTPAGGIQVYSAKKDFPKLALGDTATVRGVISLSYGVPRVKITRRSDISITAHNTPLNPEHKPAGAIDEDDLGKLLTIEGEITEAKGSTIYIDDGEREALITLKKGTGITAKHFPEGAQMQVAGILEVSRDSWTLLPRTPADVVLLHTTSSLTPTTTVTTQKTGSVLGYYIGGTLLVGSALAWSKRERLRALFKKTA